jgi:hypothetical protein
VPFAMCKLLYLFTSQYFTFKYNFKTVMNISMNVEACCFNTHRYHLLSLVQFTWWLHNFLSFDMDMLITWQSLLQLVTEECHYMDKIKHYHSCFLWKPLCQNVKTFPSLYHDCLLKSLQTLSFKSHYEYLH